MFAECVNFIASKLIQHVIAIGSIRNLDTGLYFCHKMCQFSNIKVDSTCKRVN
jgi:hypothetical protein